MIYVIAAIFILVISFVIALVSLIREQSKIEKAAADASLDADRINVQEHQTVENKVPASELANSNFPQPQSRLQDQSQASTQSQAEDLNPVHLAQKPWWESEIQKRDEEPKSRTIDWQNTSQVQQEPHVDVLKTASSGKASEPQDSLGVQTSQVKDQNLEGSFSVSDLKGADQES